MRDLATIACREPGFAAAFLDDTTGAAPLGRGVASVQFGRLDILPAAAPEEMTMHTRYVAVSLMGLSVLVIPHGPAQAAPITPPPTVAGATSMAEPVGGDCGNWGRRGRVAGWYGGPRVAGWYGDRWYGGPRVAGWWGWGDGWCWRGGRRVAAWGWDGGRRWSRWDGGPRVAGWSRGGGRVFDGGRGFGGGGRAMGGGGRGGGGRR